MVTEIQDLSVGHCVRGVTGPCIQLLCLCVNNVIGIRVNV